MAIVNKVGLALAANETSPEQLQGTALGYASQSEIIRMGATCNAAKKVNMTLVSGQKIVVKDQPIADSDRFPEADRDFIYVWPVIAGEQQELTFRETAGGAATTVDYSLVSGT